MTPAGRLELEALARIDGVRNVLDAILCGRWYADAVSVDAAARILTQAAQQLRWRDAHAEDAA